jgi:hypothetical protein
MYYRNTLHSEALCFRLRLGSVIPGAKGYSILIDADGKFGSTGPNADPNYLPATTGTNGNPGFELEVDLFTQSSGQTGIALYNVDGTSSPVLVWSANDYTQFSQVSIAGTNDNGDPDFYLDFFIPWNKITGITSLGITASTKLRFIPTTVMAPQPAIGGPKSDIYGLDDANYSDPNLEYETLLSAMPGFSITELSGTPSGDIPGTNNTQLCTAAPTISSVTTTGGSNGKGTVSGTWTKLAISPVSAATVTVYLNGVALSGTASVTSGGTWTFAVPAAITLANKDKITAQAVAAGENRCQVSNTFTVTNCSSSTWQSLDLVAPNGGSCLSSSSANNQTSPLKGFDATNRNSASWKVYAAGGYANTTQNSTSNVGATTFSNNGSNSTWTYSATGSWQFARGCSGGSGIPNDTYTIWYQDSITGCKSDVTLLCGAISGGSSLAGIIMTPVMSPATITNTTNTIKVVGAAGSLVSLYVNGEVVATATLPGTFNNTTKDSVSFTDLNINVRDVVSVVSSKIQGTLATTYCSAKAPSQVVALCTTPAPSISVNSTTHLLNEDSVFSGTGPVGAGITVYDGTTNLQVAAAVVGVNGMWTTTIKPTAGGTYYAKAQTSCNISAASPVVNTTNGITAGRCGGFTTTNITTATNSISGTITPSPVPTTVNLYEDGYLIGSQSNIINTSSWTIAVANLYSGDGVSTGKLTIGIQETGKSEQRCVAATFVQCTIATLPSFVFKDCTSGCTEATVKSGDQLTYTISNAIIGNFYSLKDSATGTALANGIWASSSTFDITTNSLVKTGAYKVQLVTSNVSPTSMCSMSSAARGYVVLPIELLYFRAENKGAATVLNWQTTIEMNGDHFDVLKSTDGLHFSIIGTVKTTGRGSAYSFTDHKAGTVCYYQLKMVDRDGRYKYSKIIVMRNGTVVLNNVRPNPFTNEINVSVYLHQMQPVTISVIDASGRQAAGKVLAGVQGLNDLKLGGLDGLPPGVYILKINCGDRVFQEKMVKLNK